MIQSRLHSVLGNRRMKVAEFQRQTGVSYGALHNIYHGKSVRIDYDTLNALCCALGCQPGDLLEYVPDGKGT